jgi:uncharacterized membrane protein YraQ (UPF0718 family)
VTVPGVQPIAAPRRAVPGSDPGAMAIRVFVGLLVLGVLFAIRATAPAELRLGEVVQDALTLSISVVIESLPFVILGITVSIAVQLWVPSQLMFRILPQTPITRRLVLSLLGVLLPVCECGNVPLARSLMTRGLTMADAMTFLMAAPILNPITIIVTYQAFGFSDGILLCRILGGFLIANMIGLLISRHPRQTDLLTPRFHDSCRVHAHIGQNRRTQALRLFTTESSAMLPALFIGSAIAGLIQTVVARNVLLTLGQNPVWSVLALIGLAFVISLCSTVDAFFILSLGSTFSAGAIVAFLVFGPMIDIKMLALLRTTFTARTLGMLTTMVGLLTAVLGLALNLAI